MNAEPPTPETTGTAPPPSKPAAAPQRKAAASVRRPPVDLNADAVRGAPPAAAAQ
jgi:hypothetical protein